MKTRHLSERREPAKDRRFSWGRVVGEGGYVQYRLFRRDFNRRVFSRIAGFTHEHSRAEIARDLRKARRHLLDTVDAIELHHLGLTT